MEEKVGAILRDHARAMELAEPTTPDAGGWRACDRDGKLKLSVGVSDDDDTLSVSADYAEGQLADVRREATGLRVQVPRRPSSR